MTYNDLLFAANMSRKYIFPWIFLWVDKGTAFFKQFFFYFIYVDVLQLIMTLRVSKILSAADPKLLAAVHSVTK
jgi:hypothetical protein